jgi:hypothetical protein
MRRDTVRTDLAGRPAALPSASQEETVADTSNRPILRTKNPNGRPTTAATAVTTTTTATAMATCSART